MHSHAEMWLDGSLVEVLQDQDFNPRAGDVGLHRRQPPLALPGRLVPWALSTPALGSDEIRWTFATTKATAGTCRPRSPWCRTVCPLARRCGHMRPVSFRKKEKSINRPTTYSNRNRQIFIAAAGTPFQDVPARQKIPDWMKQMRRQRCIELSMAYLEARIPTSSILTAARFTDTPPAKSG